MTTMKILKIATIGLMILMASSTVSADQNDDPPMARDPCSALDGCHSPPEVDPWVRANVDFELDNCKGVKEKITEDEWTVTLGGAKGGPVIIGFVYVNYKSVDKGWSWQFTCDLEFTADVYATGGGSLLREVAIYADTPSGKHRAEGNCFYNGIMQSGCRTPTIIENGDEYVITAEGMTNGYPTKTSAESQAVGINQPADQEEDVCLNHHACLDYPSPGQIIDPRVARHAPVKSDAAEIEWTTTSEQLGVLYDYPDLLDVETGLL